MLIILFLTGQEAYLRTKQILDEATNVSNMLFVDEEDMSQRYQKVYEREDAYDGTAAAPTGRGSTEIGSQAMPGTNERLSAPFGASSLFFPGDDSGKVSEGVGVGVLAAAASMGAPLGKVERRPEERLYCDAFLDLQSMLVTFFFIISIEASRITAAASSRVAKLMLCTSNPRQVFDMLIVSQETHTDVNSFLLM